LETYLKYMHLEQARDADRRTHEEEERERADVEHAATGAAEFLQEAKCLGARTYVDCNEKSS
jgi:hypothetical protein